MDSSSKSRRSKSPEAPLGVELNLIDLPESPWFPHKSPPDPTSTPMRGSSEEEYGGKSESSGSATTSSSGKPSSRRTLGFGRIPRIRTTSHSSDSDKATPSPSPGPLSKVVRLVTPSKSPTGEVDTKISTSAGHYTVAAKDVSVLERISKRAHSRANRVRKPHEVFVELEELRSDPSEELEWEETARWIKFEEDVEEGSGRWGRPHVSALTFHSLVELRRGLEEGLVLLDVEGEDFPSIADEIVKTLIDSGQLPEKQREHVLKILLKKHKHSNDITLWEKLKKSAVNRDGRLHHIGEGLRRMNHANPTPEEAGSPVHHGKRRGSMPNFADQEVNDSYDKQFKRTSSVPILESMELSHEIDEHNGHAHSGYPNGKKVVFSMAEPEVHHAGVSQASSGFISDHSDSMAEGNVTGTTDITIDVEGEEEHVLPKPASDSSFKRNKSVLSLMDKIPDEAESLTVLVGGVQFLQKPIVAFVRLEQSHLLGDLTEVPVPVRFIYLLLGPAEGHCDYHEVGRAMATLMSDAQFHDVAYGALCKKDFLDAMDEFLDDSIVLPPGDWDEEVLLPIMHERNELRRRNKIKEEEIEKRKIFSVDPLKHSRRPFGGIWRDLKKLAKRWPTDFKEILHIQPIISILFLYIAFLAPALAFGGLMEEITANEIGETETLLATGFCGIVYGLFSVQPLAVLAFTGPLLLFETVIYRFATDYFSIPYVEWRAITSLWLMVMLVMAAITEISFIVKQFTRFSEEIFTGIIAFFFIYEASLSVYHIFERNPLCGINYPCGEASHLTNTCMPIHEENHTHENETYSNHTYEPDHTMTLMMNGSMDEMAPALPYGFRICNQPNTALWSTILCVFTFFIAAFLRKLRHSKLFGKQARRLVSDFGMMTAILLMVILAYSLNHLIAYEKLVMPPNYGTTIVTRGWFINPFNGSLSVGEVFGAIGPAFLLCILIFIENQLTLLLINKPEHKLRKKVGYHMDLLVVGILTGVSGIMGMPWLCAAPIRSIQHLQALSVYSTKNPPGEKPKLLYIREQRVTTIVVHILIILTPLAYIVLAVIPISVAVGVFFYLAYTSLNGIQLMTRVRLLFTPPKHHPNVHYVRKVRTWKMHLYTIIQVVCVACLFGLKNSPGGMLYPVIIILLVPLKWFLGKFLFTHEEIEALDSEEDFPEDHVGHRGDEFGEFEAHVPY